MGSVTVTEFISVDGVIDSPGGEPGYRHTGWTFDIEMDPTVYGAVSEAYDAADGLLLGRTTYDGFSAAWPAREAEEGDEAEFARYLGDLPKYVVSTTLQDPSWRGTSVLRSLDEVARLREGGASLLVAGSASLVQALQRADLVDRYHLLVFPVVLGSGKRLFADDVEHKTKLELIDQRRYSNGVQLHVLEARR